MNAKTKPAKILELLLKGISVILCIVPALFIQVIRVLAIAIVKGFPSLTDELTGEIDGWFKKGPAIPEEEKIDIVPIINEGIMQIIDKERSVHIAHAIYTDKDIQIDIEQLIKKVKGQA